MKAKVLFAFLSFCAAATTLLGSIAQTLPAPQGESIREKLFVPNLNALCAGGLALQEGCDAIRARESVDASKTPWRAIGRVNYAGMKTRNHCTGTLVSEHIVLTAAHCLYNEDRLAWIPVRNLRFVAGYQRGAAVAVSSVERYILDPNLDFNDRNSESIHSVDWALLVLKEPIGRETGFAELSTMPLEQLAVRDVALAGYAGLRAHVLSVADECGSLNLWPERGIIITSCAAMQGDSGAPLFVLEDGSIKVVGILSAVFSNRTGLQNISVPASTIASVLRAEAP